jgi:hypothetical protein
VMHGVLLSLAPSLSTGAQIERTEKCPDSR